MAGSAQLWPGPRMRAFFRAILTAQPGVDAATADQLSERLTKRIARMLVWDASGAEAPTAEPAQPTPPAEPPAETSAKPPADVSAGNEPVEAFDPFAFSIVVVLKRQGRSALMKRLESIADAAHLHQMAVAQHIGVDKSIKSRKKLREAIVTGAEQRLADRRAAAS